jgi:hypothetical protein
MSLSCLDSQEDHDIIHASSFSPASSLLGSRRPLFHPVTSPSRGKANLKEKSEEENEKKNFISLGSANSALPRSLPEGILGLMSLPPSADILDLGRVSSAVAHEP